MPVLYPQWNHGFMVHFWLLKFPPNPYKSLQIHILTINTINVYQCHILRHVFSSAIAIENGPAIVDLPLKDGYFPLRYLSVPAGTSILNPMND